MNFNKSALIAQALNKSAVLDQAEIDFITPLFQNEYIKAGNYFIKAGMAVHKVAFVAIGLLKRVSTNEKEKHDVMQFITEDHFFGDFDA